MYIVVYFYFHKAYMKIAINTRFLLKDRMEGIGWYTYEICKHMVAAHPEDQFYFFFDRQPAAEFIFGENVHPVILFPPARHPILFYIWFEIAVGQALKRIDADVFFSPDGFLCLNSSVPSFITIHDVAHIHFPEFVPYMMRKYYRYFMPKFVKKAQKIFTVSNYSKQDLLKTYKVKAEKILVFPNGCREIFAPLEIKQIKITRERIAGGDRYFVCIGSIHPRKNLAMTIRAFSKYRQLGYTGKLVIVGRMAWHTTAVKKAIEDSLYRNDIILTGTVSDQELVNILGASDALVYTSLFEGFGIPILEAMQCGVPVIASNTSSMPEVGGNAALYVDPISLESIVAAMVTIHKDPVQVLELLNSSKEQMSKFNWTIASKGIYSSFKESKSIR